MTKSPPSKKGPPSPPTKRGGVNSHLSISEAGIDLILSSEGFSPTLYDDQIPLSQQKTSSLTGASRGNCTIGYGHLVHRGPCDGSEPDEFKNGISQTQARALFQVDVAPAEAAVRSSVTVDLTQNEFDALVSFTFNLGAGNLKSMIASSGLNQGNYDQVPAHINRYVNANHKPMKGLVARRAKEAAMFSQDALWKDASPLSPAKPTPPLNRAGSEAEREAAKLARKDRIGAKDAEAEGVEAPGPLERAKAYIEERNRKLANYEATMAIESATPSSNPILSRINWMVGNTAKVVYETLHWCKGILGPVTTTLGLVSVGAWLLCAVGVPAEAVAIEATGISVELGLIGMEMGLLCNVAQGAYLGYLANQVKLGKASREELVKGFEAYNEGWFDTLLDILTLSSQLKTLGTYKEEGEALKASLEGVKTASTLLGKIGAGIQRFFLVFESFLEPGKMKTFAYWVEKLKAVKEYLELYEKLKKLGSKALSGIKSGGKWVGEKVSEGWDATKSGASKAWDFGKDLASKAGGAISDGASAAWGFAKGLFGRAEKGAIGAAHLLGFMHDHEDGSLTGPFDPVRGELVGVNPRDTLASGIGHTIVFINGVRTTYASHVSAAKQIAENTGKTVVGIYNMSGIPDDDSGVLGTIGGIIGSVRDLVQCVGDKAKGVGKRHPAIYTLIGLIRDFGNIKTENGGLHIEAHSQGSIIVSEALRQLAAEGQDLRNLDVTTWGNAAWTFPEGPTYRHRVHAHDFMPEVLGSDSAIGRFMNHNRFGRWMSEKMLGPLSDPQADTTVLPGLPGVQLPKALGGKQIPSFASHELWNGKETYLNDREAFKAAEKKSGIGKAPSRLPAATLPSIREMGSGIANTVGAGYEAVSPMLRMMPALPMLGVGGAEIDAGLRAAGHGLLAVGGMLGAGWDRMFGSSDPGKEQLQRSGTGPEPDTDAGALRRQLLAKEGPGFAPSGDIVEHVSPHLGFDPSMARLHTGPQAAGAARDLRASAFTIGNDVFFGANRYDPRTGPGMGLLAHELTHVGQQGSGLIQHYTTGAAGELEREAQATERSFLSGIPGAGFEVDSLHLAVDTVADADPHQVDEVSGFAHRAFELARARLAKEGLRGELDAIEISLMFDGKPGQRGDACVEVWATNICDAVHAHAGARSRSSLRVQKSDNACYPPPNASYGPPAPNASTPAGPTDPAADKEKLKQKIGRKLDLWKSSADFQKSVVVGGITKDEGFFGSFFRKSSEMIGGATLPPDSLWTPVYDHVAAGKTDLESDNTDAAQAESDLAKSYLDEGDRAVQTYINKGVDGGEKAVKVLTGVRDAAVATEIVLAAPAVAAWGAGVAAGMGASAAGAAVAGTGAAAVAGGTIGATTKAGFYATDTWGSGGKVKWDELKKKAEQGGISGAISGAAGGFGKVFAIGGGIATKMGVSGGIGGVTSAASTLNDYMFQSEEERQKGGPLWRQMAVSFGVGFASGAVTSGIGEKLGIGQMSAGKAGAIQVGMGAATGSGGSAIQQYLTTGKVDAISVFNAGLSGAGTAWGGDMGNRKSQQFTPVPLFGSTPAPAAPPTSQPKPPPTAAPPQAADPASAGAPNSAEPGTAPPSTAPTETPKAQPPPSAPVDSAQAKTIEEIAQSVEADTAPGTPPSEAVESAAPVDSVSSQLEALRAKALATAPTVKGRLSIPLDQLPPEIRSQIESAQACAEQAKVYAQKAAMASLFGEEAAAEAHGELMVTAWQESNARLSRVNAQLPAGMIATNYDVKVSSNAHAAAEVGGRIQAKFQAGQPVTIERVAVYFKQQLVGPSCWVESVKINSPEQLKAYFASAGMKEINLAGMDVRIQRGLLKPGSDFIITESSPIGTNAGGAIEITVSPDAVELGATSQLSFDVPLLPDGPKPAAASTEPNSSVDPSQLQSTSGGTS